MNDVVLQLLGSAFNLAAMVEEALDVLKAHGQRQPLAAAATAATAGAGTLVSSSTTAAPGRKNKAARLLLLLLLFLPLPLSHGLASLLLTAVLL